MKNSLNNDERLSDRRASDPGRLTRRRHSPAARLGAVVLAGALVLGVTACTSGSDSSGSSGADSGSSTATGTATVVVTASDGWARPTAAGQTVGSAYMTVTGGSSDNSIVAAAVAPDVAASAELHEVTMVGDSDDDSSDGMNNSDGMNMGGMMRMEQVSSIAIAAGSTTTLEPGGYHLMLIGLAAPLTAAQTFDVTLEFSGGETLVVPVTVRNS
jgi:periplasmic copper chaperone A